MAEAFKHLLGPRSVTDLGRHLKRAWPDFERVRFERLARKDLEGLELKARALQLCAALEATLPQDFACAAQILEDSLGPPGQGDELSSLVTTPRGLAGWVVWPMGEFVARRGLGQPRRALACLHALTQRFTAEFAIRAFLEAHPSTSFETLTRWTEDPSCHVRRLVSEGSRPRLPWGPVLRALVADPAPSLPLLERLQDDPSAYVRRSVANHLNEIAKDHPELMVDWLARHLPGASSERRALLKHASRTLIKRGDQRVLAAWGVGARFQGTLELKLRPKRVRLGGQIELALEICSAAKRSQELVIDYAVQHLKADGSSRSKVFKGWSLALAPGESRALVKQHSLRRITARRYHPGTHALEILVNGRSLARGSFELRLA